MELVTDEPRVKVALTVALIAVLSILIFRLGDQASADVVIDESILWAEHGLAGEIVQINASSGEIVSRVVVSEPGETIEAIPHRTGALVVNRTTGTARVVDGATLRAGTAVALEIPDSETASFVGDATHELVYGIDGGSIVEIDPLTLEQKAEQVDRDLSSPILDRDGRLLAVDRSGPFVRRLSANGFGPFVPLGPADETAGPHLVRAGDAVFAVEPNRLSISELRPDASLGPATCFTGSGGSTRIAGSTATRGAELRVIAHNADEGTLSVGEPSRERCFEIDLGFLGDEFGDPVVVGDLAYLPNWDLGRIDVVDLSGRIELGSVTFSSVPGDRFELEVFGSTVLANEPQGPFAAIVDGTDVITIQKLEAVIVGSTSGDGTGFGAATPLVAGTSSTSGTQALSDQGRQIAGDDGQELGDGEIELVEAEVLGVAVNNVEVIEDLTLAADFGFSSGTVAVGEVVRFTDRSQGNPVEWIWDFDDGSGSNEPDVDKSWSSPGEYRVQLAVADAAGNRSGSSTLITVVSASTSLPPLADFVFDSSVVEAGTAIEFTSLSTGDPESLEWTFGDGATADGVQVSHTYQAIGDFTVTLVATNGAGSTSASTVISVVEATEAPVAAMRPLPRTIEVGQFVTVESVSQNDPTDTQWDFGDGRRRSGTSARHAWTSPGTYRVRLTVSNSAGSDSTVDDIRVVPRVDPPDARFTETALDVLAGDPITFTDLSLNGPTSIEWDFGDGATATGSVVTHAWNQPGTFQVTLRVANEAGRDRRAKSIRVIQPVDPPIASFGASTTRAPLGSSIQFWDTSVNTPTRWLWAFGDGSTSVEQAPTHLYAQPGTYTVRLRVGNKGGASTTESTVTVFGPPQAAFDMQATGLTVTYWDKSSGDPTAWSWQASTGDSSGAQNPEITFDEPGTYEMTLITSNAAGSSAPLTRSITVYDDPEARFVYEERFLTVAFFDRSGGGPTTYLWDFGDGNTSSEEDPIHSYDKPGAYDVTLTASNPTGEDSLTRRVRIDVEPLEADFECELDEDDSTIVCDAASTTGATSYAWSAAGASSIEGATDTVATFRFPPCGRFTIALDVANDQGETDRKTRRTPSLGDGEIPEIRQVDVESNADLEVVLRGSARNDPETWTWSIDGGELIAGAGTGEPTFRFTEAGTVDGSVTASNECGTSDTVNFSIDVEGLVDPVDPDA